MIADDSRLESARGSRPRAWPRAVVAAGLMGALLVIPPAAPASAAPLACSNVTDAARSEVVFAIRATGTTCAVARRLAGRTGRFAHSVGAPWKFGAEGFACRGGWSWAQTRPPAKAGHAREMSEGVSLARWRCTRGDARVTFVRTVNYGG